MITYINLIKQIVPSKLKFLIKLGSSYAYDLKRFYNYSGISLKEKTSLIAMLVHDYHIIEKGLTMPETRLGFGKERLYLLIRNCNKFILLFGSKEEQLIHSIRVIIEYKDFHDKENFKLDDKLVKLITELCSFGIGDIKSCNQKTVNKEEYFNSSDLSFSKFSWSRSSIRNYSDKELSIKSIIDSVNIARNAPSACNRQTARAYVYTDKNQINSILKLQGGNRGFGHLVNKLIIVTSEIGVYFAENERNQTFIDGGLFAMNLLYGLHYNKIVACILNCSHSPKKDKKMRKLSSIKDSEVFIAMISCGHAPENFKVALSPRHSIEKYFRVIE